MGTVLGLVHPTGAAAASTRDYPEKKPLIPFPLDRIPGSVPDRGYFSLFSGVKYRKFLREPQPLLILVMEGGTGASRVGKWPKCWEKRAENPGEGCGKQRVRGAAPP